MHSLRVIAVVLAALMGLVSCSRDPNVVKKRYFDSANKYFERGRYKEAIIQYKNALKRDGKYGPAHYKLALTAIKLNDVTGAVMSLRRAIELIPPNQPEHWDAVVKLSEIYLQFARSEKTYMNEVDSFTRQMVERDPNSFDAHRLIGDLNYAKASEAFKNNKPEEGRKLLDTAAEEYKKADAIKPGQQGVSMQLARALFAKADFAGAEKLYRSVIEKDKAFPYSYSELYQLLMYQQRPAEGEQLLKQAFQNNPKEFGFLTTLATHYYAQRRREDMLSVLQQIKSHSKDFGQAYFTVGDFYLRMGDGDSAIREYKEGMAKDVKRKSTYWKAIIEVLMRQGKRAEAADLNAQILKEDPNDNDARGLSASFLLDKGDVAKALAELTAVVTRAPDNPVSRYNLGRAHAARGELEQARQQFDKAIELRPDYVAARLALAQLQVTRGQFDAALKTADAILLIDRGNVNARLIQSASLMGQKKYGESRNLLDAMLKANPSSPDVFFQLGVVNLAENKFKEAEDAFRRAYQVNPANSRGLMGIVETNMAQNKPESRAEAVAGGIRESAQPPGSADSDRKYGSARGQVRSGGAELPKGGRKFGKGLQSDG